MYQLFYTCVNLFSTMIQDNIHCQNQIIIANTEPCKSQRIPHTHLPIVRRTSTTRKVKKGTWQSFVAGGFAGIVDTCCTMPLDTIKVQMQCNGKLRTPIHAATTILRTTGPFSFYAGVQPFMLQCAGKAAIRFYAFEQFKYFLGPTCLNLNGFVGNIGVTMLGGLGAGLSEAIIWTAPMERLKVLRQTEAAAGNAKGSGSIFTSAKSVIHTQGFTGLYRGGFATCIRQGTSHMTRFAIYAPIREFLNSKATKSHMDVPAPAWVSMLAGGLAGALSVILNNPVDVVKSRIQAVDSTHTSMMQCTRHLLQTEGSGAFLNGLSARVPRLFFSQAITFTVYERMVHFPYNNILKK
tara:strand:+ start:501 stop:1553 length:1053 start_codon:yes stop_codon:yes gene_type:complete